MSRQSQFYLVLAVLSALTWVLDAFYSGDEFFQPSVETVSPDYFGKGYTKIEMNELGVPRYKLDADGVKHFNQENTTEMEKPVLTYYNSRTPPWIIRSETGVMTDSNELLFLNGKVFISREQAPGVRLVKLNTTNARIKPKENYAETDDWAELIMPPDRASGTGAKLYFADPIHLELLSNVRGMYVSE